MRTQGRSGILGRPRAVTMKRIVCLANSRKPGGRCVAGKTMDYRTWVRPVSDPAGGSIADEDRHYEDGRDVDLLDVIDIPILGAVATPLQAENWQIDPRWYWTRVDQLAASRLEELADAPGALWLNGFSTVPGKNDRIPDERVDALESGVSLHFIRVPNLRIRVITPGIAFGDHKRKVRGAFRWSGEDYDFTITDPVIEARFKAGPDGEFAQGERYLTVSLAEPDRGFAYKLIAAVIAPANG